MKQQTSTESKMTETPSQPTAQSLGWRPDLRAPWVMVLIALLGLQLLLALGVSLTESRMNAPAPQTPLVDLEPNQVQRVTIAGSEPSDSVTLSRRSDGGWVLADLADFPADGAKMDRLLTQLAGLKRPLPVATSEEARTRFKVADDAFERRLVLGDGKGELATLLFGESGGFRRLFGRPADDPAVYELPLAISDVSNRRDDWIDRSQLQIERPKITAIGTDDWTLTKGEEGWTLDGQEAQVDQSAVDALLMKVANLGYRGVLGIQDEPDYDQENPKLTLVIHLEGDKTRTYRISQAKDSEDYVLKDADRPYYFKLSQYDLEGVLDLKADDLKAEPEGPAQTQEPADELEAAPAAEDTPATVEPKAASAPSQAD
ncbi:DUF4340 domain-containing protein [Imhoffiella purpurea]|uniref:DUF4340 domain-containing protein n=1 Tax=Imhoffiella purpurea TaxID=1249627 RepID=W9V1S8_9GAMM|nr:DUF4340 domain-containing protein [Imhoffiella purpurea]EXJ13423.1 hypothetical protein D779_3747 [Imhoffiella purpurea]